MSGAHSDYPEVVFNAEQRAFVYMEIIINQNPTTVRLHPLQNEIVADFRHLFTKIDVQLITKIDYIQMRATPGCLEFIRKYEPKIPDGLCMAFLRHDASKSVSSDNIFNAPRVFEMAVEMVRNVEGVNERNQEAYTSHHLEIQATTKMIF
ncbi:Protein CBG14868 [Caenorhabditis briggsae]|uniref:Polysaccharide biosynthesis domain-containing protein n=2 Tax=Caenorhabditis briggsae TaxID=6238 RepID=A0AAE9DYD9_CAEBR|nr:Protein CBG14868 [Caenorhabditis briggsae]ULU09945.1 hypothetical protein L3Y34_014359 [Caenorhabditis briggsae]UMM10883.1 hypothetical protein L5515_000447 [Caenorhabditis briggsae]CAP33281.1 Protein CBG14868 [Caenorhabditis briggsae]